jgi:uncharacterized protein (DUF1330 family)
MTVYAIALVSIADREAYGVYERGFMEIFMPYGGRLLAVDDVAVVKEGDWPCNRTILIEFPDAATFDAWYHSTEYQALAQRRRAASTASIVMVAALPGGGA